MSKAIRAIQVQLQIEPERFYTGLLDGIYGLITDIAIKEAIEKDRFRFTFNYPNYKKLFNKTVINQDFVDNIEALFNTFNRFNDLGGTNPLFIAYMLATVHHETNQTFLPLREYGRGKGRRYGTNIDINGSRYTGLNHIYYGRGYVQLTWLSNYLKMGKLLGIDLVNNPDLALEAPTAASILVIGSLQGLFTGKGLDDYITTGKQVEFINARRVINGTDKAHLIAGYANKFLDCITLSKV